MGRETHDVVIIGAGIAGTSLAYFLARAGHGVCVVEKSVIGQESTGRSAGNIGQTHRPPPDLPLAMRAVQLWKELAMESDLDFEYRQHGSVKLAWNDEHAADLKVRMERDRAGGLACRFLDRQDTRELLPTVCGPYVGSVYCPSDSSAQPYLACTAMARAAIRVGAVIHEHREVTGIDVRHGTVCGVSTATGSIAAGVVVNAAGAWSRDIGRAVGVRIAADVRRSHLMVTERLPEVIKPVVSTEFYGYFRQTVPGNVLIGYAARPVEGFDRRVTSDAVRIAARRAVTIIPALRGVSMIRGFTGFTTWTSDLLSVVGPVRDVKGLYVSTAFCGRGFGIGPAVGEMLAQLITEGRTALPIEAYSPDRFAREFDEAAG